MMEVEVDEIELYTCVVVALLLLGVDDGSEGKERKKSTGNVGPFFAPEIERIAERNTRHFRKPVPTIKCARVGYICMGNTQFQYLVEHISQYIQKENPNMRQCISPSEMMFGVAFLGLWRVLSFT